MAVRPLSTELKIKAEKELNEDSRRINDDLIHIRDWLEKQPHLNIRPEDQSIVNFLRGCKYSLQRAKEKIDYFYTSKTLLPEWFVNRDPLSPEIQGLLNAAACVPLTELNGSKGTIILYINWRNCNADEHLYVNIAKLLFMTLDILMNENDNLMISGMEIWSDFTKWDMRYVLQFTPVLSKKVMLCLQHAYPLRIKGIYCTNSPSAVEMVYNLTKPFFTEKLQTRMHIFSEKNLNNLYKFIPQSSLPQEFGGNGESIDTLAAKWKEKVESYRDWFLDDQKYCTNERLRPGEPKTSADMFGIEGTFRKLIID